MAPNQNKSRLSLLQIIFFSVGHVLNDLFSAIYSSYLLTFQTKILGLPNNIVGLLWFIPCGIDAPLALLIGYLSDNFKIPYLSKFYGKRKSWHLVGCTLVGIFTPFVLMPCFFCGGKNNNWLIVVYYVSFMIFANIGWGLTQSNFLALIPDIAKKQSEMVKLGAVSSATTLICGIYVYVITWVLLGRDVSDTLSFSQWKAFMNLVIIVVATGAFFAVIFHTGTREPNTKKDKRKKTTRPLHHVFSMESVEKLQPAALCDRTYDVTYACGVPEVIQGVPCTEIINPSFSEEEDEKESKNCNKTQLEFEENKYVRLSVAELEKYLWQAVFENKDNKKEGTKEYETDSVESSGYGEDSSFEETDGESIELFMPETFMDMVPNHSTLILNSRRGSNRVSPFPSPRLTRSASKRTSRHSFAEDAGFGILHKARSTLHSDIHNSPLPTSGSNRCNKLSKYPLASGDPHVICPTGIDPRVRARLSSETQESPFLSPRSSKFTSPLGLRNSSSNCVDALNKNNLEEIKVNSMKIKDGKIEIGRSQGKETINDSVEQACDLTIIDRSPWQNAKRKPQTLFKNPLFYKLGAAYMFTRISQTITNSYMPLYLTDFLKFEKASIAYFPLVILFSGVFSSLAAKKLNKLLGNKWTFVLGAIAVIGASGWFYLLTEDTRSFAYIPAIVSGTGTSIMFVTSLALAAEFVDADKGSGAFLMASMGFFAKVAMGVLFGLLQEFSPEKNSSDCPECKTYVRYVFSLTPGVAAFMGIISFLLFIPATIQCRPISETVDAETQTDGFISFNETVTTTMETFNNAKFKTVVLRAGDENIPDMNQVTNEADVTLEVTETLDTRF